jgi:hypothetical protein
MNHKNLIILFIAILFIAGACGLPSGIIPVSTEQAATQTPSHAKIRTATPQTSVAESFPLAPDSQMDPNSSGSQDPQDKNGNITIHSTAAPDVAVTFYETELPQQGWTLRYSDSNYTCGVTQYWKKDNIYLRLDFIYEETGLSIKGQYTHVDPQAIQELPKDFPLPEETELIDASDTSWEFYILQDYIAVIDFYTQKLAALNWQPDTAQGFLGTVEASCGDDSGCSGGGREVCPPGVIPMPTPTLDSRQSSHLVYVMPDGNGINLSIRPHQNATILNVELTFNTVQSAGLPQDVPIYQGASVVNITPGTATFQVNASLDTLKNFYEEQLITAGWVPDGLPIEASGTYLQNWKKGDQQISIIISPYLDNNSMLMINCSTCMP